MPSPEHARRGLLAGAAALLAALAGCRSVSRYEFRADPVVWSAADREGLGYRETLRAPVTAEHAGTVDGDRVRVTVRSRLAVYAPGGNGPTAAEPAVGALSTPRARLSGESFNPLATREPTALLTTERGLAFLGRVGLDRVGHRRASARWARGPRLLARRPASCLDRAVEVASYGGLLAGEPPSVAVVHLARVRADSVVLAAAVHGRDLSDDAATAGAERPLVGPDGYLAAATVEAVAALLARVCGALRYDR